MISWCLLIPWGNLNVVLRPHFVFLPYPSPFMSISCWWVLDGNPSISFIHNPPPLARSPCNWASPAYPGLVGSYSVPSDALGPNFQMLMEALQSLVHMATGWPPLLSACTLFRAQLIPSPRTPATLLSGPGLWASGPCLLSWFPGSGTLCFFAMPSSFLSCPRMESLLRDLLHTF